MPKRATRVLLSEKEQHGLEELTKRHRSEQPLKAGCPISQWTGREIADELVGRGIVEQISPRHAAICSKKGSASHRAHVS